MQSTISNKTFKSIFIMLLAFLLLGIIIYLVDKLKSQPASINDGLKQSELLKDSINNQINDKITTDDRPKHENIIYKDKIVYRDKIIYKDTFIYKTSPPKTIYQDKIVYKDKIIYQDKIVYRDKPEPYHPYGKGNCQLVIYTTCSNGGKTTIWIDGIDVGFLDKYQKGSVYCNSTGTISKTVLSGKHHIKGKDQMKRTWDGYVTVYEDECQTYGLTCK